MITADTITDEQIRELESDVLATGSDKQKCRMVDIATRALLTVPSIKDVLREEPDRDPRPAIARVQRKRRAARARCAEILNARAASKAGS